MVTSISTLAFCGIKVQDVEVQVQISPGLPAFTIVGLADKTIAESRERVRAALQSIGMALPAKKIIVNLAPADLNKEGSHFDLAITCALIGAMGGLPAEELQEYIILGELSLDGTILPVAGALPAAMGATERNKGLICPHANGKEAAWSGNSKILAPNHLLELINHFKGYQFLSPPVPENFISEHKYPDISDIIGQEPAKRALEIAAAGGHNMLMSGPPGSGKSMLAQRLPGILPQMNPSEILECSTIASIAGLLTDGQLTSQRPFRAPHHSCSMAAMVGGGMARRIKPGEISLAHNGVLFLDELPEFSSAVLDALRQPMEAREVLISRSNAHINFPANFQLIAAMNPCKCGYLGDSSKECRKAPICGDDYQMKISGPILDRFDIFIYVPEIESYSIATNTKKQESSKYILERVTKARELQYERYEGYGIYSNANLSNNLINEFAFPTDGSIEILNEAAKKFRLSMRGYNRVLKLARTIADLAGDKSVNKFHLYEALNYRISNYSQLAPVA